MSNAIGMFLRQVVLQRGLPFEVKLPQGRLADYESGRDIKKQLSETTIE